MTGIDSKDVQVLRVTDAALAKVLGLRAGEDGGGSLALWVEVSGSSGGAYTYDIYFQATSEARPQDWSDERGGLALVVPADSIAKIRGATLDLNRDLLQGGMVMQNPNQPRPRPPPARPWPGRRSTSVATWPSESCRSWSSRSTRPSPRTAARRPRRGGGRRRLSPLERRLRGLRDGDGDPKSGHRSGHPRFGPRDHSSDRRHRPRGGHQPVLRGRQDVSPKRR